MDEHASAEKLQHKSAEEEYFLCTCNYRFIMKYTRYNLWFDTDLIYIYFGQCQQSHILQLGDSYIPVEIFKMQTVTCISKKNIEAGGPVFHVKKQLPIKDMN